MDNKIFARGIRWLARFIQLQLFLTVFSLPILIAWGLPISILSPVGNLLFGPVLTLFLLLSSFIFFFQLVQLPHAWLILGLEKLTSYWLSCMHNDAHHWLIGFPQPGIWFLALISLASLFVLTCNATNTLIRSIICWSGLFLLLIIYGAIARLYTPTVAEFPCNNGALTIINTDNTITIIDPGYMGQRISAPSWAQYTLMPHLVSTYGACSIDTFITMHNNSMTLEALERLATTAGGIRNIYLPRLQHPLTPSVEKKWKHLRITAFHKKIALKQYDSHTKPISISNTKNMTMRPHYNDKIGRHKGEITAIDLQIDNENIPIYAPRYAKNNKPSSDKTVFMHETVVRAVNDHEKGSFGHSESGLSTR